MSYLDRPVLALSKARVLALATDEGHSLCVTEEGQLLAWGDGSSGQVRWIVEHAWKGPRQIGTNYVFVIQGP